MTGSNSSTGNPQRRHWVFTLWLEEDCTPDRAENIARRMFDSPDLRYGICQLEQATTGRLHLQGYSEWSRGLRLSEVKRRLKQPTIHLEPRSGSRADARRYCMSKTWKGESKGQVEGCTWEQGEWVKDTTGSVSASQSPTDICLECLLKGMTPVEIAAAHPKAFFTHSRKVMDTYEALEDARKRGIWEPTLDDLSEEE